MLVKSKVKKAVKNVESQQNLKERRLHGNMSTGENVEQRNIAREDCRKRIMSSTAKGEGEDIVYVVID